MASRLNVCPSASSSPSTLVIASTVWKMTRLETRWLYLITLRCSSRLFSAMTPPPPNATHCANPLNA
jgi:hypothetical protein